MKSQSQIDAQRTAIESLKLERETMARNFGKGNIAGDIQLAAYDRTIANAEQAYRAEMEALERFA